MFTGARKRAALIVGVVSISAILIGGANFAAAATTGVTYHGCEKTSTRTLFDIFSKSKPKCPAGSFAVSWNQAGQRGPQGTPGAKGPIGPQGPSGVLSTSTTDLNRVPSVPTGGNFSANKTLVGTVGLTAGTYLVSVNAKATPPSGGTGTADVFPQFFVYNGVALADFSNDLFNVGSGALENGANSQIDSYYSGSSEIVVPAGGETLDVYAFGYDSDRGASSYVLDDLSVTATSLNPATG